MIMNSGLEAHSHVQVYQQPNATAGQPQCEVNPSGPRLSAPLRVCHVSMCLKTGGLERLLVEFARRTNPQKFQLQFVALGEIGPPAEEIRELGLPVHQSPVGGKGRIKQMRALSRLLFQEQIDVLHTHNTYAHFYGSLAAKLAGVPVVLNTQHGRGCGVNWKQRVHFALANRLTDRILAVSEDSARICRSQDPFSRQRIEPLWNGIDLQRFAYRGPSRQPHAISVARLSPEKDFPTLLKATRLVVDRFPEFRLSIVGDGNQRPVLEKLIHELWLNPHVTLLGERHDVPALLEQSALFVSSTLTEGISLTLLEAMAVGLPIITTAVGGNPEVVQNGVTGHLVPPADPEALAAAICEHLQQTDCWETMGTLARSRVEQQFNIERMIREYEDLYCSLTIDARHRS